MASVSRPAPTFFDRAETLVTNTVTNNKKAIVFFAITVTTAIVFYQVAPSFTDSYDPKLELAERLIEESSYIKPLKTLFKGFMGALEERTEMQFSAAVRDKIWDGTSKEPIQTLKKHVYARFCDTVLDGFNAQEIREMLNEHRATSIITKNHGRLMEAYDPYRVELMQFIVEKLDTIGDDWVPRILAFLQENGATLFQE